MELDVSNEAHPNDMFSRYVAGDDVFASSESQKSLRYHGQEELGCGG